MRSYVLSRARSDNYPGQFDELSKLIGEEKTDFLVQHFGGVSFYFPSRLNSDHSLIIFLGLEVAQKVCSEFGGLRIEIPRLVELQRSKRNALIISDIAAGMSQSAAARKYQMTVRNIRYIKNKCGNLTIPHVQ
jgi:Mor family transcriptional regulator